MRLLLGNHGYTAAQLAAIYGRPVRGDGLVALAHQLITVKLNALTGAAVPQEIVEAVCAADLKIGNHVVPPVGTGTLSPSATSILTNTLDHYNNGLVWFGPPHCSD